MIVNWEKTKILIRPGITDFRKQINGLARIVSEELKENVFSGVLFLFCNRDRTRLKILYWNKNGFCLWMKRLEKDKFPWPTNVSEAKELTFNEFRMLLRGIDFFKAHQKLEYESVS